MTSELRPALTVWVKAYSAWVDAPEHDNAPIAAAAVIEADREAVRAEMREMLIPTGQAAATHLNEAIKWKALAETLAGALEAIRSEAQRGEGSWLHLKRCIASQSTQALTSYKEQRDVDGVA